MKRFFFPQPPPLSNSTFVSTVKRDIAERGRTVDSVLMQYMKTVRPSFEQFIAPTKNFADLIVPRGGDNYVAIDLLAEHIRTQLLRRRGVKPQPPQQPKQAIAASSRIAASSSILETVSLEESSVPLHSLPSNVVLLTRSKNLRSLHSVIRDPSVAQSAFALASQRLCRLTLLQAIDQLYESAPTAERTVMTPTGAPFSSLQLQQQICGVSIVRGGELFESSLRELEPDATIGKIVIDQTASSGSPQVYYAKLPESLNSMSVILMDATIATGTAMRAGVQVLVDHGVPESSIVVVCLAASAQGLSSILRKYPQVRIVSSWLDDGLDEQGRLVPGFGSALSDRFFATN